MQAVKHPTLARRLTGIEHGTALVNSSFPFLLAVFGPMVHIDATRI